MNVIELLTIVRLLPTNQLVALFSIQQALVSEKAYRQAPPAPSQVGTTLLGIPQRHGRPQSRPAPHVDASHPNPAVRPRPNDRHL